MKIKQWVSVLLCMLLCACAFPVTAFAAENYDVWVGNTQITSDNADDVLHNGAVSYDAKTNTLTLNNASLTQIRNNTGKAFTINVSGDSTVAITSGSTNLIESNAPLTITGSKNAKLTLSGVNQSSYISCIDAQGDVTVEIITLILTNSNDKGISSTGNITVKNGAYVKGDTGHMFYAVTKNYGKLTITDSTVIAPLENTTVSGWMSAWVNEMDISNSTVDIVVVNGIYATGDVSIKNSSNVTVTANGKASGYPAIWAGGSMTIENSTVNAASYTFAALYAEKDLKITDAFIKAVTTANKQSAIAFGDKLLVAGTVTVETETQGGGSYNKPNLIAIKTPAASLPNTMYDVYAGTSAADAKKVEGSPFAADTNISDFVNASLYFRIVEHTHTGGRATCSSPAICEDCSNKYGAVDASNHTNLVKTDTKPATHLAEGSIEYWHCKGCDNYYSDKEATKKISLADTSIPKLPEHTADGTGWHSDKNSHWNTCACGAKLNKAAHSFEWIIDKEATETQAGSKHQQCSVCGYAKEAVEIPATGTATNPSDENENPSTGTTPNPSDENENPSTGTTPNPSDEGESPSTGTTPNPSDESGSPSTETTDTSTSANNNQTSNTALPRTGDNSNIVLWITVMLIAAAALTGTVLYSRKKKYSR